MDESKFSALVEAVVKELLAAGVVAAPPPVETATVVETQRTAPPPAGKGHTLVIDLPDPTEPARRYAPGVRNPQDAAGLEALVASTTARIGVGRAGPRYTTASLLLFQADHAVTQDALYRDVDQRLLDELGLFSVQTKITGGKQEYLLRPDLGRQLSDEAKRTIASAAPKARRCRWSWATG
jgi:ethanolamine ammonia-lyase small subunit